MFIILHGTRHGYKSSSRFLKDWLNYNSEVMKIIIKMRFMNMKEFSSPEDYVVHQRRFDGVPHMPGLYMAGGGEGLESA